MTPEYVREQVKRIEAAKGDPEAAHGMEDELHSEVLAAIADGAENAVELAAEALKTLPITFVRWCA